jgi:voltage-gated sodium channel
MQQPVPPAATGDNSFSVIVNHRLFIKIVIFLILFNSLLVGVETFPAMISSYGRLLHVLDVGLLWLFTIEIGLRLLAVRPTWAFFKNGWNVFDFIIVASGHLLAGAQFVTILRILRILRMLRTFSVIPSLRRMVNALLMTIPALGNIILLMSLVMYIFGVIGTVFFAEAAPEYFGSLPASILTLFQVATLESWASGVMRPLLDEVPWAWVYFVIFIMIGTFVVINLFLGVIVNNMSNVDQIEKDLEVRLTEPEDKVHIELLALKQEIAELKTLIMNKNNP